jgi:hypothetical protein
MSIPRELTATARAGQQQDRTMWVTAGSQDRGSEAWDLVCGIVCGYRVLEG